VLSVSEGVLVGNNVVLDNDAARVVGAEVLVDDKNDIVLEVVVGEVDAVVIDVEYESLFVTDRVDDAGGNVVVSSVVSAVERTNMT
jgi:hypothetical protein